MPDTIRSVNELNLSGDVVEIELESDPVCSKLYPSNAPMALFMLEVGGYSASQDP